MADNKKKVLILFRKAPYGSVYTAEGFRTAVALGTFEVEFEIGLAGDGVYFALKGQDPSALDMKPLVEGFPALAEDPHIKGFFIDKDSLVERGLKESDLAREFTMLDRAAFGQKLAEFDVILPF